MSGENISYSILRFPSDRKSSINMNPGPTLPFYSFCSGGEGKTYLRDKLIKIYWEKLAQLFPFFLEELANRVGLLSSKLWVFRAVLFQAWSSYLVFVSIKVIFQSPFCLFFVFLLLFRTWARKRGFFTGSSQRLQLLRLMLFQEFLRKNKCGPQDNCNIQPREGDQRLTPEVVARINHVHFLPVVPCAVVETWW